MQPGLREVLVQRHAFNWQLPIASQQHATKRLCCWTVAGLGQCISSPGSATCNGQVLPTHAPKATGRSCSLHRELAWAAHRHPAVCRLPRSRLPASNPPPGARHRQTSPPLGAQDGLTAQQSLAALLPAASCYASARRPGLVASCASGVCQACCTGLRQTSAEQHTALCTANSHLGYIRLG